MNNFWTLLKHKKKIKKKVFDIYMYVNSISGLNQGIWREWLNWPVFLSVFLVQDPPYTSTNISSYLSIYKYTNISFYLFIHLPIYLAIYLSIHLPIYLTIYLSITNISFYLSMHLPIYLANYLAILIHLPVYI